MPSTKGVYTHRSFLHHTKIEQTYQWGFSFVQLNIMIILLWLWTVGIAIMWISAKFTMKQRGREHVAGQYKAVYELSEAMQEQILPLENEDGRDMRHITEATLRQRVTKDLKGGAISYESPLLSKSEDDAINNAWTFKAWMRREMWWLIAFAACVVISIIAIRASVADRRDDLFVFFALPLALGFAMYVGTTHQSRGVVLFWAVMVVCVVPAIIAGVIVVMLQKS